MRYITNDTASPIYVAGRLIPPYDGRHFEDHELPPEHKPASQEPQEPAGPTLDEQLEEIRAGSIKEITPQLQGLTYEALERLAELEVQANGDAARKGLLQAIGDEKLRRADEQMRQDEADKARVSLDAARAQLLHATVALQNLTADATQAERTAAEAAVDEAQAKVDALTPQE